MASKKSKNDSPLSRRAFIEKTAAASLITIVPSHTISSLGHGSPNDMINLAAIGVGNRGGQVIGNIATPDVQTTRGRSSGFLVHLMQEYNLNEELLTDNPKANAKLSNMQIFMLFATLIMTMLLM